eukprot:1495224-Rhodomonas_salina.1
MLSASHSRLQLRAALAGSADTLSRVLAQRVQDLRGRGQDLDPAMPRTLERGDGLLHDGHACDADPRLPHGFRRSGCPILLPNQMQTPAFPVLPAYAERWY